LGFALHNIWFQGGIAAVYSVARSRWTESAVRVEIFSACHWL